MSGARKTNDDGADLGSSSDLLRKMASMKILFVGQAPSKDTEGKPPFTGKCGAFLASLMCVTQDQMLEAHDFTNVLSYYPGKGLGGDKFPIPEAIAAARKILTTLHGRTVVLLGANVARVFGAKSFRYFEFYQIRNPEHPSEIIVPLMGIVPHPSGVNRFWNKPQNRLDAAKFMGALMEKHVASTKNS